jgi:integrase/recombinase XerD
MSKKRLLLLDWSIKARVEDLKPTLIRYRKYLVDNGFRTSTIDSYVGHAGRFLQFAQSERPPASAAQAFREQLLSRNLSRSSLNNYSFAIKCYYRMIGEEITFPFLKRNNHIPYYFDQEDVLRIFGACNNLKHYAMLQTLFYGCLRASELCNLDDSDVDLKARTLRIREGKGGKDGIVMIKQECVDTLKRYLEVRPPLDVGGRYPLFYTDFGKRWDRKDLYRMFMTYKEKAGIEKHGGLHVFSRHTSATIMVANGCDVRIVQELLRHKDIRTTLRYAHVSDRTKREKYEQYFTL